MASDVDIKAIIARCLRDPVFFCRTFLEDWFPDEMPWVHRGLLAIMTQRCSFLEQYGDMDKIIRHFVWSPDPFAAPEDLVEYPIFSYDEAGVLTMTIAPNTGVMMPRGFSKTTLCNAKNLWKILHSLTKFTLYVSESGPHASTQLGNIKTQLESNEKIRAVYGDLVGKKWTEDEIICANGVYVAARGRGGQVRGLLKNGNRPDDITIDDLEDEESVLTDGQRAKAKKFLYSSVMPALRKVLAKGGVIRPTLTMLGTLLHKEAVLMTVAQDPEFNFIRFAAVDRDGDALWADNMSLEALEKKKFAMSLAGELASYYMEYMSKLSDASTAKFSNVRRGEPKWDEINGLAIAVDPAISEALKADFFSIVVMAMEKGGQLWVLDTFIKKGVLPREQIDKIFEYYVKWKRYYPKVGIESIAYQKALVHLVREEMFRKKEYFEITEIAGHAQSKDKRILGILQPRYANGYIKHCGRHTELETQLLDYPNGKKDGPDAAAMCVTLLDPYAASAVGDKDLAEDEYDPEEDMTLNSCP